MRIKCHPRSPLCIYGVGLFQEFQFDCYFRQEWIDERLGFEPIGNMNRLVLASDMIKDIWRPVGD